MDNFNEKLERLLKGIGRLVRAIDDENDWYIASLTESDQKRKVLARTFFYEKRKERLKIAKEAYEHTR